MYTIPELHRHLFTSSIIFT